MKPQQIGQLLSEYYSHRSNAPETPYRKEEIAIESIYLDNDIFGIPVYTESGNGIIGVCVHLKTYFPIQPYKERINKTQYMWTSSGLDLTVRTFFHLFIFVFFIGN